MKKVIVLIGLLIMMTEALSGQTLKPDSIITTYPSSIKVEKQIFDYETDENYIRIWENWIDTLVQSNVEIYRDGLIQAAVNIHPGSQGSSEAYWEYDSKGRITRMSSYLDKKLIRYVVYEYIDTDTTAIVNFRYYLGFDTLTLRQTHTTEKRYDSEGVLVMDCYHSESPTDGDKRGGCESTSYSGDSTFIHKTWWSDDGCGILDENEEYWTIISKLLEESGDTTVTKVISKRVFFTMEGDTIRDSDRETRVSWDDGDESFGEIVFNRRDRYTMNFQTKTDEGNMTTIKMFETETKYHPSIYWRDVLRFDNIMQLEEDEYEYGQQDELRTHKNWFLGSDNNRFHTHHVYYYGGTTSNKDVIDEKEPNLIKEFDDRKRYFSLNGILLVNEPSNPTYLIEYFQGRSRVVLFIQ